MVKDFNKDQIINEQTTISKKKEDLILKIIKGLV